MIGCGPCFATVGENWQWKTHSFPCPANLTRHFCVRFELTVLVHLQRLVLLVGGARARCHGLVLVVTVLGPDFLALGTLVIFVWREVAHQFRVQLLLLPSTVCLLEARLLQRWFLFVRLYGQLVEDLVLGQVPVGLYQR